MAGVPRVTSTFALTCRVTIRLVVVTKFLTPSLERARLLFGHRYMCNPVDNFEDNLRVECEQIAQAWAEGTFKKPQHPRFFIFINALYKFIRA